MKYHPNKSVLFVTFTVEEGLLLLCNPLCLAIIQSCLAAAQSLYPVRICHRHLLVELRKLRFDLSPKIFTDVLGGLAPISRLILLLSTCYLRT
jgi:hypothetical protein